MKTSWRKRYTIYIIVFVLVIVSTINFPQFNQQKIIQSNPNGETFTPVTQKYLDNINITCYADASVQLKAYNEDSLASTETFDKYKVTVYSGPLAMLNLKISPRLVTNYRTMINNQLLSTGINFGGKYTLVYVGLTGWGYNYYFIDRINGKGYIFPYQIGYVDTRKDSSLIIINSRLHVLNVDYIGDPQGYFCGPLATWVPEPVYGVDLRPYYYTWDGAIFHNLGNQAPINIFWQAYK